MLLCVPQESKEIFYYGVRGSGIMQINHRRKMSEGLQCGKGQNRRMHKSWDMEFRRDGSTWLGYPNLRVQEHCGEGWEIWTFMKNCIGRSGRQVLLEFQIWSWWALIIWNAEGQVSISQDMLPIVERGMVAIEQRHARLSEALSEVEYLSFLLKIHTRIVGMHIVCSFRKNY